ncbi:MAG: leucine-rich repeat domain-containing protein, partial [Tannerella sp.]|nr:leucine-rich repeat domain-containing protein [Tannerella sp.]
MKTVSLKVLVITAIFVCCMGMSAAQTPVEIHTAEDMAAIGKDNVSAAGSYILMNDLTLDNWKPIGSLDNKKEYGFSGTFDGNGHTITIIGFYDSSDYVKIGVFGSIDEAGTVKNLFVTGNICYKGKQKSLYIGGIAGVNYGRIVCCVSKIALEGSIFARKEKPAEKEKLSEKMKNLVSESEVSGGCIAGSNQGTITNCYSAGSVLVYGDRYGIYAGGIAGINGYVVRGGIGFSVGSGGGGISVSQGKVTSYDVISNCYSTASVFSSGSIAMSGGIVGNINIPAGVISKCVSLNKTVEASAKLKSSAAPVANTGILYFQSPNAYYCEDIVIRKYKNRQEQKPGKIQKKNAVAFSATQEQSWWHYPDGVTKKQQPLKVDFSFGGDEQSPWVWKDELKRPVMYWEKTDIQEPPATIVSVLELEAKIDSVKMEDSNIKWRVENETVFLSGYGKLRLQADKIPWASKNVNSAVIGDSITEVNAIGATKISSIVLGKAVAKIGTFAFFNFNNLVRIEVRNTTPPEVGSFAFKSTPVKKIKLIVPAGTKAVYEKN